MMLKVWTDAEHAGLLDRFGERGSAFAYLPKTVPQRAASVTMPVRLASWDVPFGLAPIFDMYLPEGALRERLRLAFAKATGAFDELDLLTIVGPSQEGSGETVYSHCSQLCYSQWPCASQKLRRIVRGRARSGPARPCLRSGVSDALSQTSADIQSYNKDHPAFAVIGEGMRKEWEKGRQHSLAFA